MKRALYTFAVAILFATSALAKIIRAPADQPTIRMASTTQDSNVTLIGRWQYGPCYAIFVENKHAYVSTRSSLDILDISNPTLPQRVGQLMIPSIYEPSVYDLHVSGNYAYLAGRDGLRIIDVSTPSTPTEVGFLKVICRRLYVSGNFAYVAGEDGLHIIDISISSIPSQVGLYKVERRGVTDVKVVGNYAYLIDWTSWSHLQIIDISTPSAPTKVSSVEMGEYNGFIDVSDNYAYATDPLAGLHVIDVSSPSAPIEVGFLENYGIGDIYLSDNFAYTVGHGFHIINVSIPLTPTQVGSFDTRDYARDIFVSRNLAYVTDTDGLYILRNDLLSGVDEHQETAPKSFSLEQNYPNPFNPSTIVEFALPKVSYVTLKIYDLLGNEVATLVAEKLPAGKHQRVWEAKGLASGVYVYRLQAGEFVQTKKLILLR